MSMFKSPEFQALRREYMQGVLQRCAHLREEIDRMDQGASVDLAALRQDVHKLRGSGGFYGFPDLSAAAAAAEDVLDPILDGELPLDRKQLVQLIRVVLTTAEASGREVGL